MNRKAVPQDFDWVSAVADLCLKDLPSLPLAPVANGLNLPDVELEALCDAMLANIALETR